MEFHGSEDPEQVLAWINLAKYLISMTQNYTSLGVLENYTSFGVNVENVRLEQTRILVQPLRSYQV